MGRPPRRRPARRRRRGGRRSPRRWRSRRRDGGRTRPRRRGSPRGARRRGRRARRRCTGCARGATLRASGRSQWREPDARPATSCRLEHSETLDGEPLFWCSAPGADVLYVHGVPTTSDVWAPLLDRTGGIAPDLPGFGRTTKRGDLDFSIDGYTRWLDRFAEHAGLGRCAVVAHGWGALALPWAVAHAERVVLLDPVPLLAGHRWSGVERALRAPGLGEVAIGLAIRPVLRRRVPAEVVAQAW